MKKLMTIAAIVMVILATGSVSFLYPQGAPKKPKIVTLEDTIKNAKQNNKDIVVVFSGTGLNELCDKINKEVFNTDKWKKDSPKKYIYLSVDCAKSDSVSPEQKEYNESLKNEFWVNQFPIVFLLDNTGTPYARTGYVPDANDPKKYLDYLATLINRKRERDDLLKKARTTAKPDDKMPKYESFINKLAEWGLGFSYRDVKDEIIAVKSNENDTLKGQCAVDLYWYYFGKKNEEKSKRYLDQLKDFDEGKWNDIQVRLKLDEIAKKYIEPKDWNGAVPELKKLFEYRPDGAPLQLLHWYLAVAYSELGDRAKTKSNLENALRAAPNGELAERIKQSLEEIKKSSPPEEPLPGK